MTTILSYSLINNPIVSYTNKFKNLAEVKIMEPKNIIAEESPVVIFFTGGSSIIIPEVYNQFLNKLNNKNISICTPSFNYKNINKLIKELNENYKDVILAGHSSGCSIAIDNSNNELVKKLVLLDPVKTNLWDEDKYDLINLESVLFLNALKSYKFSLMPLGIPFVPEFLKITKDDLDLSDDCDILNCHAKNYGHCDILDNKFSDQMHNSRIAIGNKDRSPENLDQYQEWATNVINSYLKSEKIEIKKY